MKKWLLLLLLLPLLQFSLQGQNIQAFLGHSTYLQQSSNEPYVEVLLSFEAASLRFEPKGNGNYGARVETMLVFKKNDSIIYVSKQEVKSPEVKDPVNVNFPFMDIQRVALGNGIYTLEVTLIDKVENSAPVKVTDKIIINYPNNQISVSDIQLIANLKKTEVKNMLSKNGYDMQPFSSDIIAENVKEMMYYAEIYNADKTIPDTKSFKVQAYVEVYATGKKIDNIAWGKTEQAKKTNYVLSSFRIDQLKRGNYNLVIEVLDTNNQMLLYKKLFFQRVGSISARELDSLQNITKWDFSRSMTNDSLLTFFIEALLPISHEGEQNFIRKGVQTAVLEEKQNFFQRFWETRNPENPEAEWKQYYDRLLVVEANFSFGTKRHGYVTDQGRVYLQYGAPNHIIDEKFKSSDGLRSQGKGYLPYQMWRYDMLKGDKPNRMFVFWCPQIAGEYNLLVSNALGEFFYDDWEYRLSRGAIPMGEVGDAGKQFIRGY